MHACVYALCLHVECLTLQQTDAVIEALRVELMVLAVCYMLHATLLETFASPTEGMLTALALGVQNEKEVYIAQVAHDIGKCEAPVRLL